MRGYSHLLVGLIVGLGLMMLNYLPREGFILFALCLGAIFSDVDSLWSDKRTLTHSLLFEIAISLIISVLAIKVFPFVLILFLFIFILFPIKSNEELLFNLVGFGIVLLAGINYPMSTKIDFNWVFGAMLIGGLLHICMDILSSEDYKKITISVIPPRTLTDKYTYITHYNRANRLPLFYPHPKLIGLPIVSMNEKQERTFFEGLFFISIFLMLNTGHIFNILWTGMTFIFSVDVSTVMILVVNFVLASIFTKEIYKLLTKSEKKKKEKKVSKKSIPTPTKSESRAPEFIFKQVPQQEPEKPKKRRFLKKFGMGGAVTSLSTIIIIITMLGLTLFVIMDMRAKTTTTIRETFRLSVSTNINILSNTIQQELLWGEGAKLTVILVHPEIDLRYGLQIESNTIRYITEDSSLNYMISAYKISPPTGYTLRILEGQKDNLIIQGQKIQYLPCSSNTRLLVELSNKIITLSVIR